MPETRKHAAIMFTDIVGYTRLMGTDEGKAVDMLSRNRSIHQSCIERFNGTFIKEIGDGILASFSLASEAVRCAIEIQKESKERGIPLKIGIHEGEMIFSGSDVIGDGVNIASRLQEDAQEGCINISAAVYSNVKNKSDIQAKLIGEKSFKNVDEPIKVYKVITEEETPEPTNEQPPPKSNKAFYYIIAGFVVVIVAFLIWHFIPSKEMSLPTPEAAAEEVDRSIAVLPFTDMSPNKDQEYFSDGMMDAILTNLFKIGDLDVTSRTSVMQYKGTIKTIPEIANELGVTHVLEGSVSKAENKVRITVQLIDAVSDKHIWAESYDREFIDVFAIQSEIAQQIAGYLKAEISPEVMSRLDVKLTDNTEALDLYLKAKSMIRWKNNKAEELLHKVISLDSNFVPAYASLGEVWILRGIWDGYLGSKEVIQNATPFLEKALELNYEYPDTHVSLATIKLFHFWDFQGALEEMNIAYQLNPSDITLIPIHYLHMLGKFEEALERAKIGYSIDPNEFLWALATSHFFMGHYDKALVLCNEVLKKKQWSYSAKSRLCLYLHLNNDVIRLSEEYLKDELNRHPIALGHLATAYYNTNQKDKTDVLLDELKQKSKKSPVGSPSYYTAMVYAQMEESELAFESLENAYKEHEVEMIWLKVAPTFNPLHDDPRWQVMLDKVGFPD